MDPECQTSACLTPEWLERALACFEPPLEPGQIVGVCEELQGIARAYAHDVRQKKLILGPFARANESEEDYQLRLQAASEMPRRRGRQPKLAQHLLVFRLRDLLMQMGCHYGAPKSEERRSRLAMLAQIMHQAVGAPPMRMGWRSLAERMADPVFQFRVILGDGFQVDASQEAELRAMLHEALVVPPKRKT